MASLSPIFGVLRWALIRSALTPWHLSPRFSFPQIPNHQALEISNKCPGENASPLGDKRTSQDGAKQSPATGQHVGPSAWMQQMVFPRMWSLPLLHCPPGFCILPSQTGLLGSSPPKHVASAEHFTLGGLPLGTFPCSQVLSSRGLRDIFLVRSSSSPAGAEKE